MTRLLISVRGADEARIAVEAGADLIDVKEPQHGSLGRADDRVIAEIMREVAGRLPVSIALGELAELGVSFPRLQSPASRLDPAFAKLGLAKCATVADWPLRWAAALNAVVPPEQSVAVIYADWVSAQAPSPDEVLSAANDHGCGAVLVDTFNKQSGGLLDLWSIADLERLIADAHRAQMLAVVAGSLNLDDVPRIVPLGPNFIAVRGAVCLGGRTRDLDGRLIREFQECLRDHACPAQSSSVTP